MKLEVAHTSKAQDNKQIYLSLGTPRQKKKKQPNQQLVRLDQGLKCVKILLNNIYACSTEPQTWRISTYLIAVAPSLYSHTQENVKYVPQFSW